MIITIRFNENEPYKIICVDTGGTEPITLQKTKGFGILDSENKLTKAITSLSNCINVLAFHHSSNPLNTKDLHVPYRNSKLTKILKDMLVNQGNSIMIGCISPSIISYENTLNTLKFCQRAKLISNQSLPIQISPKFATTIESAHSAKSIQIVEKLKSEISRLRKSLSQVKVTKKLTKCQQLGQFCQNKGEQYRPSERVKKIEDTLKEHFDKENEIKRKIFELEQKNHELGIHLFEMKLGSAGYSSPDKKLQNTIIVNQMVSDIKSKIDKNNILIQENLSELLKLQEKRNEVINEIQNSLLSSTFDKKSFEILINNSLSDSAQIDYARNNHYTIFLLRQRENYIKYLKRIFDKDKSYF